MANNIERLEKEIKELQESEDCYEDYNKFKFTPEEAERFQTVPVGYTRVVSNNQRFKLLGNGWTVDVIAHILRRLNDKSSY